MVGERFHPSDADKLIDPNRYESLAPNKIIEAFGVEAGDAVADLGAGNGFFTIPLAEKTNTPVYAVDIEPELLDMLKERAKKAEITNIQYVVSDLEEIKLPDHSVDKAITSFVLHEIPNLPKALTEIKRILKSGGQIFILEWEAVESETGPPLHERISSIDMAEILKKHGFEVKLSIAKDAVYGLIGTLTNEGEIKMFNYTVETTNGLEETLEKLRANLMEEKFGVLWEFDIKEKLEEKGLEFDQPYKVLEVCNPHEAKKVLDKNKLVGYFLPCKIVVYGDQGKIKIGLPKPTFLMQIVEDDELNEIAVDIENRLISAIDKSI
jgi:ubiquinone/menaquinone biosynthesis C-methylase UbiE